MRNKNKLTIQITKNYFFTMFAVTAILVAIPLAAKMFLSLRVWHGDEFIYPVLHVFNRFLPLWVVGIPFAFWFLVTYIFFKKIMNYLEEMLRATKMLVEFPEEKVRLSDELYEFEQEINQIREESIKDKRLVKEAEKKKNDLLVYLAHDLRTPLTSIIGYVSLLQNETYSDLDDKKSSEYIQIISDKAYRLEGLINDFFEIAKIGMNGEKISKERTNLSLMIAQITSEFLPLFAEKGLEWELEIAENSYAEVNVIKFERVLENVIRNVLAYAPSHTKVKLTLANKGNQTELSIKNQSEALSPEVLEQLFDPFFRADQARNTKTGNAGLGLAIAKQIIEEHGGKIAAKNTDGYFEIILTI